FTGTRLVEAGLVLQPEEPDGFEQAQGTKRIHVRRVLRRFKAHRDMALRAKVVDLVRLHFRDDASQVAGIRQITVMEMETGTGVLRGLEHMVDALCVEERS